MKTITTDRWEEYCLNKNWPYFYTKNLFESPIQKHIPQIFITRKTLSVPKLGKE